MRAIYLFSLLGILVTFFGCSEVLDKTNLTAINPQAVWNDQKLATAYVNKLCMDNLPTWDAGNPSGSNMSDEAAGGGTFMTGELTEDAVDYWPYVGIRNINLLLKEIEKGTLDKAVKDPLKGQAHFLRAWLYFEMVKRYGGVPLLLEPQQVTDDLMVTRNKTSEVFAQVIKDLDEAAKLLPPKWTGVDAGRITAGAALALKGRVLLFYASPQFNPANSADRWVAAYNANKVAKDYLVTNGYGLFENFTTIWFNEGNKEAILIRRFMENVNTHAWERGTRPISESQGASGYNQPTFGMTQAFPMKNGLAITHPSSGYDTIAYWLNRDPRFASTIAYNGCLWELSNKKGRRQWTFNGNTEESIASGTGFYCRKAIDETHLPVQAFDGTTTWIEIRFAEVLLNLAECAAMTGKVTEAYVELKALRKRAGIIAGTNDMYGLDAGVNETKMVDMVMHERRIELAFEGKRHWDMRRRKLFETQLNGKRRMRIFNVLLIDKNTFLKIRDTLNLNNGSYTKYFTDTKALTDTEFGINYKPNYYFYAIPNKYLIQNKNLAQTKGWTNGTFDPLE